METNITKKKVLGGELALFAVVIMNSFSVVLMLYSGSGISAISSVPYAFSEVFPFLTLGTWTYIFQGLLICSLMILRKRFVLSYLLSFLMGIALSNRCKMPIIPTDLFPRELTDILKIPYSRVKICFDVTCLMVTLIMTWGFLGQIRGLGIGTVLAAFTMGKVIGFIGEQMDKKWVFTSVFEK